MTATPVAARVAKSRTKTKAAQAAEAAGVNILDHDLVGITPTGNVIVWDYHTEKWLVRQKYPQSNQ